MRLIECPFVVNLESEITVLQCFPDGEPLARLPFKQLAEQVLEPRVDDRRLRYDLLDGFVLKPVIRTGTTLTFTTNAITYLQAVHATNKSFALTRRVGLWVIEVKIFGDPFRPVPPVMSVWISPWSEELRQQNKLTLPCEQRIQAFHQKQLPSWQGVPNSRGFGRALRR